MDDNQKPMPVDRFFEIFDQIGPLYRRIQRKVERDTALRGLTVGVRAVLVMLHFDGPMTVPQLGRAQALSRQFVQRMVNEAASRELVAATPNPAHKRSALIRLTAAGEAVISDYLDRERGQLRPAAADLTEADAAACSRVLGRLLQSLDDVEVD